MTKSIFTVRAFHSYSNLNCIYLEINRDGNFYNSYLLTDPDLLTYLFLPDQILPDYILSKIFNSKG